MRGLEDIKAGDEVLLRPAYTRERRIATVERTTPTRILVGGKAYARRTGREVGGSEYHSGWIMSVTPENREHAAAEMAAAAIRQRCGDALRKLERLKVTAENIAAVEAFLATQVVR